MHPQQEDRPFFQYVAYTAPHWPLHAHEEDIARYKGRFDSGWDALRKQRLERMVRMGIIDENWLLTDRDPQVGPWKNEPNKAWQTRRMEVYAAQIDRMDQGIGRILKTLKETDQLGKIPSSFFYPIMAAVRRNSGPTPPIGLQRVRIKQERLRHGMAGRFVLAIDPTIIPGAEETYASYGIPWANLSNTPVPALQTLGA